MYNSLSIAIFHFSWKMQSDVWGTVNASEFHTLPVVILLKVQIRLMVTTDFLWAQSSQVIQSYGSALSAYGLIFLGAHFIWAFSLMFLFSGRGYWQELIESIVWAHNKLKVAPAIQPRKHYTRSCCWCCSLPTWWYCNNLGFFEALFQLVKLSFN
jgi:photosystem I P700 chlorophyll a apoprotein A1